MELEDDNTAVPRTHIDDEYAHAGERDPKILITTSRDPSTRLVAFAKEMKLVFPNAQRINRGGMVRNAWFRLQASCLLWHQDYFVNCMLMGSNLQNPAGQNTDYAAPLHCEQDKAQLLTALSPCLPVAIV